MAHSQTNMPCPEQISPALWFKTTTLNPNKHIDERGFTGYFSLSPAMTGDVGY